jgi:hypothetical protein
MYDFSSQAANYETLSLGKLYPDIGLTLCSTKSRFQKYNSYHGNRIVYYNTTLAKYGGVLTQSILEDSGGAGGIAARGQIYKLRRRIFFFKVHI